MRDILGCGRGPLPAQSVPPTIGQGLNKYRRGHGGEHGTDGRVAKDRRWAEGGRRVDGGVHSFSNSRSFEEFTVEVGTLP